MGGGADDFGARLPDWATPVPAETAIKAKAADNASTKTSTGKIRGWSIIMRFPGLNVLDHSITAISDPSTNLAMS